MAETELEIDPATDDRASPTSITSPVLRLEAKRAMVWVAIVGLTILAIYISQALLVIFGGLVFASMLDGGERLLGRVLPIARGWRLGLVLLFAVAFLVWLGYFAGSQISREAAQLPEIITFSLDGSAGWNPLSWIEALRPDRAWTTLRPELRQRPREIGGGNGGD